MAEKDSGQEELNFETALEAYLDPQFGDLEEGSITKGEVVRVDADTVLVDVNFKSEGQIPADEFRDEEGISRLRSATKLMSTWCAKMKMTAQLRCLLNALNACRSLISSKKCKRTNA